MSEQPVARSTDPEPVEPPGSSTEPQSASVEREPAADTTARVAPQPTEQEDALRRSRTGQVWVAIIIFCVILVLLLIFVLENTKKVPITYFGQTGEMPLAVAMLLAAVAGVLLAAIIGTLRILQLRRRVKKGQRG